jgi:hypothetical protein
VGCIRPVWLRVRHPHQLEAPADISSRQRRGAGRQRASPGQRSCPWPRNPLAPAPPPPAPHAHLRVPNLAAAQVQRPQRAVHEQRLRQRRRAAGPHHVAPQVELGQCAVLEQPCSRQARRRTIRVTPLASHCASAEQPAPPARPPRCVQASQPQRRWAGWPELGREGRGAAPLAIAATPSSPIRISVPVLLLQLRSRRCRCALAARAGPSTLAPAAAEHVPGWDQRA